MFIDSILYKVHRVSSMIWRGADLHNSSRLILHHCDNPICFNPDHLFEGDHQENATDKTNKGRTPHGEGHWYSKLNEKKVRQIRNLLKEGAMQKDIAKIFNVTKGAVGDVSRGETWKSSS